MGNKEELEEKFSGNRKKGVQVKVLLVLCVAALVCGLVLASLDKAQPVALTADTVAEVYCYLDVQLIEDAFAEDNSGCYYAAQATDGYVYVIKMSEKTFQENFKEILEYTYGSISDAPDPVRIEGIYSPMDEKLIEIGVEYWGDDSFTNYVGSFYLDSQQGPFDPAWLCVAAALVLLATAGILWYTAAADKKRLNRALERLDKAGEIDAALKELDSSESVRFNKDNIVFGANYLFIRSRSAVYKYDEILWSYYKKTSYNFIPTSRQFIVRAYDKSELMLISEKPKMHKDDASIAMMQLLATRNPGMLVGFTAYNGAEYKRRCDIFS